MRRLSVCGVVALAMCSLAPESVPVAHGTLSSLKKAPKKATPLIVRGDTIIVVRSLPCEVVAKEGADLYDWTIPDGIKASGEDNVLTITEAPKGSFVIRVRMTTFDFPEGKKKVTKEFSETTVNYSGTGPGPGPVPPPNPDDPLVKALKEAFKADTDPKKADHLAGLASLYRTAALMDLSTVDTVGKLSAILNDARRKLVPDEALVGVRKVIQAELRKILPLVVDEKLTQAHKDAAVKLFDKLGTALVEAGK